MNSAGKRDRTGAVIIRMLAIMILLLPLSSTAGSMEPPAAPGSTMKTLDEIPPSWHQILPASERFELVMGDEAVLDKETGLVWARDANIFLNRTVWDFALSSCILDTHIGQRRGWRLPTVYELSSLIGNGSTLPAGHPFINVQSDAYYWSSTTWEKFPTSAWALNMNDFTGQQRPKSTESYYIWPVRGSK